MRLLIDPAGQELLSYRTASGEHGDTRRYYCAAAPYRAIVVARNGVEVLALRGQVVDAQVGNDTGFREFVRAGNDGQQHSKITVYRVLPGQEHDATLSELIRQAPRDAEDLDATRIYTTGQVAELLGVAPDYVTQLAKRFKVGHMLDGRTRTFSAADIEVLRARRTKPGPRPAGEGGDDDGGG